MLVSTTTLGYIAPDIIWLLLKMVTWTDRNYVSIHIDCQHRRRLPSSPHLHCNPTSLATKGKRRQTGVREPGNKIFGPKRDEVTGEWRLHNEELNGLYASPNIRVIESMNARGM